MPSKIKKLVNEALKARKEKFLDKNKGDYIQIDEEFYKLIKVTPLFNRNMGFK